jgi:hypothetical protein
MATTIQLLLGALMSGKESYSILSYRSWASTLNWIRRKEEVKVVKRAETRGRRKAEEERRKRKKKKEEKGRRRRKKKKEEEEEEEKRRRRRRRRKLLVIPMNYKELDFFRSIQGKKIEYLSYMKKWEIYSV